MLVLS